MKLLHLQKLQGLYLPTTADHQKHKLFKYTVLSIALNTGHACQGSLPIGTFLECDGRDQRARRLPLCPPTVIRLYSTCAHGFIRESHKTAQQVKRTRESQESLTQLIPYPCPYSLRRRVSQCITTTFRKKTARKKLMVSILTDKV